MYDRCQRGPIVEGLMSWQVWKQLTKEQMVLVPGRRWVPIVVSDQYEPMPRPALEADRTDSNRRERKGRGRESRGLSSRGRRDRTTANLPTKG